MSRGTHEIARLIKAMGGNEISAYGLAHLGDYQATLFSQYSNNRKFGESLVKRNGYTKLAEGVSTSFALVKLSKKYNCFFYIYFMSKKSTYFIYNIFWI